MESKQRLLEPQLVQTGRADQFSRKVFCDGMRDGVPIALGYFAVSFSLGIAARKAGFTPFQGFLVSLLNNASAGEYAAFALIMANATYFEVAVITLIANARYLLMSCALAQRFAPETPFWHRLLIGYDVTDELFGITIARPGSLNPYYTYGAILLAAPAWASGTALGIIWTAEDVQYAFDKYGHGAIVNSSRGIMCAWQKTGGDGRDFAQAARDAAIAMRDDIRRFVTIV